MDRSDQIIEQFRQLINEGNIDKAVELLVLEQPYDQADIIEQLNLKERKEILSKLDDEQLALIFEEISYNTLKPMIVILGKERVSKIFEEMALDDVADLLEDLDDENVQELLDLMEEEDAEEIQQLLTYPGNTAGGIMTKEFISINKNWTAETALNKLRQMAPEAETIYYLYVTDVKKKLVGVISLRELIIADPKTTIAEIMSPKVLFVKVNDDQEHVAHLIERYNFLAVPVVDEEEKLAGIVTVDDVIDVLREEATEDISRLAAIQGITDAEDLRVPSLEAAKKRLPWLIALMFVGLLAGNIIAYFEETLQAVVVLAAFIPLIADMAGNTGTQALAVVVRGIAIGEFTTKDIFWIIRREVGVGVIIGVVIGCLIAVTAWVWQGNPWLGIVVGLSLMVTLVFSTLAGAIVPLLLHKFKIDPAVASGPFITTVNDIIGLTIYFTFANVFMQKLL
jgi:magnesium transporter